MLSLKVASGADSSGSPAGGQDAAPADGAGLGALQPTGECPFVRGWGGGRGGRGREGGGVGVCVCVCARAEWGGGGTPLWGEGRGVGGGHPPLPLKRRPLRRSCAASWCHSAEFNGTWGGEGGPREPPAVRRAIAMSSACPPTPPPPPPRAASAE